MKCSQNCVQRVLHVLKWKIVCNYHEATSFSSLVQMHAVKHAISAKLLTVSKSAHGSGCEEHCIHNFWTDVCKGIKPTGLG